MTRCLVVMCLAFAACATNPAPGSTVDEGLTLTQQTNTELAGRFLKDGLTITFQAAEVSQSTIFQRYEIGDLVVTASTDHGAGVGNIASNGRVLSPAGREALAALSHALEEVMPGEAGKRVLVEDMAYRVSSYLASAQDNEIIPTFEFKNTRSWTYISHCWCGYQYIGCTAGQGCYWRTVGTGFGCTGGSGNGCKARCGAGCPSDGHSGAYTYDCARHDYNLEAWTAASDDYLFAGWNC